MKSRRRNTWLSCADFEMAGIHPKGTCPSCLGDAEGGYFTDCEWLRRTRNYFWISCCRCPDDDIVRENLAKILWARRRAGR